MWSTTSLKIHCHPHSPPPPPQSTTVHTVPVDPRPLQASVLTSVTRGRRGHRSLSSCPASPGKAESGRTHCGRSPGLGASARARVSWATSHLGQVPGGSLLWARTCLLLQDTLTGGLIPASLKCSKLPATRTLLVMGPCPRGSPPPANGGPSAAASKPACPRPAVLVWSLPLPGFLP